MATTIAPPVDVEWLAERLRDWPDGSGPMYQRLAAAMARLLQSGAVSDGSRLPAERLLAQSLQVSRTTVAAAYAMLEDRRLVSRRHGSGTYVDAAAPPPPMPREAILLRSLERNEIISSLIDPPSQLLDLRAAALQDPEDLPAEALEGLGEDLHQATRSHGYVPAGLSSLRALVARRYSDAGLPTSSEEILITSGAQQGIALTTMLHLRAGDAVICEAVTHTGALDLFTATGADIHALPPDDGGLDVGVLETMLAERRPRMLYLQPSIHNPLGTVLPARHRRQIAEIISSHPEVLVVSDDTLSETYRTRRPPPPLASYPGAERVVHVASVSKLLWGGLRVGWVRAPVDEIRRLVRLKALTDMGSSIPAQLLTERLLTCDPELQDQRRGEIAARGRYFEERLAAELPSWRFTSPEGGLCLWVQLPWGSARDFIVTAARHGLALAPGAIHSPTGAYGSHLRLAYGLPTDVLDRAVTLLAAAWEDFSSARAGGGLDDLRVVV